MEMGRPMKVRAFFTLGVFTLATTILARSGRGLGWDSSAFAWFFMCIRTCQA